MFYFQNLVPYSDELSVGGKKREIGLKKGVCENKSKLRVEKRKCVFEFLRDGGGRMNAKSKRGMEGGYLNSLEHTSMGTIE